MHIKNKNTQALFTQCKSFGGRKGPKMSEPSAPQCITCCRKRWAWGLRNQIFARVRNVLQNSNKMAKAKTVGFEYALTTPLNLTSYLIYLMFKNIFDIQKYQYDFTVQ